MKKIIISFIFSLLCLQLVNAEILTNIHNWYSRDFSPTNIMNRYYSPENSSLNLNNLVLNITSSQTTPYNMVTADFDGDGKTEVVYQSGIRMYVKNSDWITLDSYITDDPNYVSVIDLPCSIAGYSGEKTIISPNHILGGSLGSYCWNGTELLNVDSGSVTTRTVYDEATCDKNGAGDYRCFIADASGYSVCYIASSVMICYHYDLSPISQYENSIKPAVKDVNSDGYLEAVFYCKNVSTSKYGFVVVNEVGSVLQKNCSLIQDSSFNHVDGTPYILSENNYIGLFYSYSPTQRINFYDRFGNFKYSVTHLYYSNPQSIPNVIERDSDDDDVFDQFCVGYKSGTYEFDCYDVNTGIRDSLHSTRAFNVDFGSRLIALEIDSSKAGEEIIISNGTSTPVLLKFNISGSADNRYSMQQLNVTAGGYQSHLIIAKIFSGASPDFLFYDSSGVRYYTTGEGETPLPPVSNSAPKFIDINITPSNLITTTDNFFIFDASANDTDGDYLQWCVDCEWNATHETTGDIESSGNVLCTDLGTPLSCSEPDEIRGDRIKFYVYDGNHTGWGNFSSSLLYDYVSEGTNFNSNVVETNIIWSNATAKYLSIKVREAGTYDYLNDVQLIITNFSRPAPDGEPRVWKITGENPVSYDIGEAYFNMPQGTYLVKAVDVAPVPMYSDVYTNCTTTDAPTTFCDIQMGYVGESNITGNELHFLVRDSVNYSNLENVNVTLISPEYQKKTTDSGGIVNFYNLSFDTYEVEFKKDGYNKKQGYWLTATYGYTVNLVPESQSATYISLTVKSNTQEPLKDVFVEMSNPFTYETYYAYTGTDGTVLQQVLDGNYNWHFSLALDGYADYETTRYITSFTTNEITLYMQTSASQQTNYTTSTGCQNYQQGVWLCGQENIHCTLDSECDGGLCDVAGYCSSFNWSWCDANNRPRNQRCLAYATSKTAVKRIGEWIMDNFFWFLLGVIFLMLITILVVMLRKRV